MKTYKAVAFHIRGLVVLALALAVLLWSDTLRAQGYCKLVLPGEGQGVTAVRPTLSGPEQVIGSTHFRIHYTFSGTDQTTQAWVTQIGYLAEYSWQSLASLGWPSPPPDGGIGGDQDYDIYVWNTEEHYEQESPLGVTQSENPSPSYPDAYTSWMEISNNPRGGITSRQLQQIIVHEFAHACQLAYSGRERRWFRENTSVFMEDVVYPNENYLAEWLQRGSITPLSYPNVSLFFVVTAQGHCASAVTTE